MYQKETQQMLSLIRDAAVTEIIPRYQNVTAEMKYESDNFKDYVTEADKAASKKILSTVRPQFPGSYSEEHKHVDRFDHDLIWQLDPVDGTHEFIVGFRNGFGCNAALLERNTDNDFVPRVGIIYIPMTKEAWYYDGFETCWEIDGIKQKTPLRTKKSIVGSQRKVDTNPQLNTIYKQIGIELGLSVKIQEAGGAAAALADLCRGDINLHVFNYDIAKDWDIAMAIPIIEGLGGWVSDLEGNSFSNLNRPDDSGGDPYLRKGFMASIVFTKEQILPHIDPALFIEKAA